MVFAVGLAVAAMEKFPVLFADGRTFKPVKSDAGVANLAPFLPDLLALVLRQAHQELLEVRVGGRAGQRRLDAVACAAADELAAVRGEEVDPALMFSD